MGIKGSATCVMAFDGATGWLVGEPNRGLAGDVRDDERGAAARRAAGPGAMPRTRTATRCAMRTSARSRARRCAREREGRGRPDRAAPGDAPQAAAPARAGRRRPRAGLRGGAPARPGRAAADAAVRARGRTTQASLLTPVLKAFLTDNGFALASEAQQVFGGHGYVHDWGVEQCVRDSRIAMIYEGTNEIQAIDLLVRKVRAPTAGAASRAWLESLAAAAARRGPAIAMRRASSCSRCGDLAADVRGGRAQRRRAAVPRRRRLPARDRPGAGRAGLGACRGGVAQAGPRRRPVPRAPSARARATASTHVLPEFDHALAQARAGWQPLARTGARPRSHDGHAARRRARARPALDQSRLTTWSATPPAARRSS